MAGWVKNLVMLVALLVWAVVVGAYLLRGVLPDAPLLGVPGAIYLALSPPAIGRKTKRAEVEP